MGLARWMKAPRALLVGSFMVLGLLTAAAAEPAGRPRVVFLGDSLTAGYGLDDPGDAYPAVTQRKVDAAGLGFECVNAGISGDTTSGGLGRMTWVLRKPVDVLVLALGGNDGLRGVSLAETARNLREIVTRVREKNPAVRIVIGGMEAPPNMGAAYTSGFRAVFPAVASDEHTALVPFLLEGVGGIPELNQADQIHPTIAGHRVVAENVWKVLEPILRAPR